MYNGDTSVSHPEYTNPPLQTVALKCQQDGWLRDRSCKKIFLDRSADVKMWRGYKRETGQGQGKPCGPTRGTAMEGPRCGAGPPPLSYAVNPSVVIGDPSAKCIGALPKTSEEVRTPMKAALQA